MNGLLRSSLGRILRESILGGQDGLVNVLGIVLGVAAATSETRIVIIAGLAALVAESISMGAVAYTSTQAARQYFLSKVEEEKEESKRVPGHQVRHVRKIFAQKGFSGTLLNRVVNVICSHRRLCTETIVKEEFGLSKEEFENPLRSGVLVLAATIVGSIIPLVPFFYFPIVTAMYLSVIICALALFVGGFTKAKLTTGNPLRNGIELMVIGMTAAFCGWLVGHWLGVTV